MNEQKTKIDIFYSRIKNNPIMAVLIIFGTIVIALSTFTNAAKDLVGLLKTENRVNINGDWIAEVSYDWNNATFNEMFTFKGEGDELHGTASLFRRKRGILEGQLKKDHVEFVIKTQEILYEGETKNVVYKYKGTISDDQIYFILQIEGGYSTHVPIEFTANRIISRSFDSSE